MFDWVLVANRGEIARRVIRTLQRLGVRAVAIYTEVDAEGPWVREADEARRVPSYLDIGAIVAAARSVDAVHPGYGFLSENPAFARACGEAGLTFIGPSPEAMEAVGDKVRARELAVAAGLPVVPAYEVDAEMDFPVLVKAAAGGGGRGMRVVERREDLEDGLAAARREAAAGFGDDRVFIEKYLPKARHIEVQVIGDVALGERECSLQRRHQKVIEEAPSPVVGEELRAQLCAEASALARAAGYENAGTVEFIANADDPSEHYFLEMNARLQVEHPVTELVTGLDLVEVQLRVAAGETFAWDGELRGHAIEARVTAEDARWLPQTGRVLRYVRPVDMRVDDGIEEGSPVSGEYDSLLAKVIAHGRDRADALARLDRALSETTILGVMNSVGNLRSLLADPDVRAGRMTTDRVAQVSTYQRVRDPDVARQAAAVEFADLGVGDGWRVGGVRAPSWWLLQVEDEAPVEVELPAGTVPDPRWHHVRDGETLWLGHEGYVWRVREPEIEETQEQQVEGVVRAPMPGAVIDVRAAAGDVVEAGQTLVVIESMKMELSLTSPTAGTVERIEVATGDRVKEGQTLAHIA
jgi:acetyl-CoA/propionyl-CoA carboxylase biotin carboxyl carrier protein